MQKQFKYIYNNEEVSREDFEKLAGDSFKWFDKDSIVSVPFSFRAGAVTPPFEPFVLWRLGLRDRLSSPLRPVCGNGAGQLFC